jgi:hypothetical protein
MRAREGVMACEQLGLEPEMLAKVRAGGGTCKGCVGVGVGGGGGVAGDNGSSSSEARGVRGPGGA